MLGQDKAFFDVLQLASGSSKPTVLQAFVDKFKSRFNTLDIRGFTFAPMQASLSFEQLEEEYSINAMATIVDIDSHGTPISYEKASLQTGKIPTSKKVAAFDANDYRQMMINNSIAGSLTLSAQVTLFNALQKLVDSHTNLLTYNRHQMVSNAELRLTESNNAGGIKGTVFSASLPDDNKKTLTSTARWFTDDANSTEGSASNPVKNLKEMGQDASEKGGDFHWEVDKVTFRAALQHSKVIAAIAANMYPFAPSDSTALATAKNAGEEAQKAALEKVIGYPITVIDSISRIDKFDKEKQEVVGVEIRSFEPNVWALVPDGKIGEILSAIPIKINPSDTARYAEYYGKRLLLTYDYNYMQKVQNLESEMLALAVPIVPKKMRLLKTK